MTRPRLLALLGIGAALAGLAWPTRTHRARRDLAAALVLPPSRLDDPLRRAGLIALFQELKDEGDARGMGELAPIFLRSPSFTPAEFDEILAAGFEDYGFWNGLLIPWKRDLMKKWLDLHHLEESAQAASLGKSVPVEFVLKEPRGGRGRLYLEGNWTEDGEIADLEGWRASPLEWKDGAWRTRLLLRLSRHRHLYCAVARTDPWPRGWALGVARFLVKGPRVVAFSPPPDPAPPAEANPARGEPKVGLSVLMLDGATWHLILPWVRLGLLPNFARLLKEGAVATLASSSWGKGGYPSLPNFNSALTGKLRTRLGIGKGMGYDGLGTNFSRLSSPLWKMAGDRGLRSAVVGASASFPCDEVPGAVVSDVFFALKIKAETNTVELARNPRIWAFAAMLGDDPGVAGRFLWALKILGRTMAATYPEDLALDLLRVLPRRRLGKAEGLPGLSHGMDDLAARTADYLVRSSRYDLLCLYLRSTDTAAHLFWRDAEPELGGGGRPFGGRLLEAYRAADDEVGRLLARSRRLMVFSDHGFGAMAADARAKTFDAFKLVELLKADVDASISSDFEAYQESSGAGLLKGWTLWLGRADQAQAVAQYLKQAAYAPGGEPFCSRVSLEAGMRIVGVRFLLADRPEGAAFLRVPSGLHRLSDLLVEVDLSSAHMGNGILALTGPGVKPGALRSPVFMPDIAPTALYLLGLPSAADMDGRLLREAIDGGYLAAHPPSSIPSYGSGGSALLRLARAVRWRTLLSEGSVPF